MGVGMRDVNLFNVALHMWRSFFLSIVLLRASTLWIAPEPSGQCPFQRTPLIEDLFLYVRKKGAGFGSREVALHN